MASDRPAPAKRPPRPAAKKTPAPPPPRKPSAAAAAAAAKKRSPVPRRRHRDMKKTVGAIVAITLVGALVIFFAFSISNNSGTPVSTSPPASVGPEKIPVPAGTTLAGINTGVYPSPIDGIDCQVNEQVASHVHAHLAIFVDGAQKQIPLGIGMAPPVQLGSNTGGEFASSATCFYWLHTHAADGIIHVESPSAHSYTLGNFFDMWGINLGQSQVGPAVGQLTAYLDGKVFPGDPRQIPLANHGTIQLDVGKVVPPVAVDWTASGL